MYTQYLPKANIVNILYPNQRVSLMEWAHVACNLKKKMEIDVPTVNLQQETVFLLKFNLVYRCAKYAYDFIRSTKGFVSTKNYKSNDKI